MQKMLKEIEIEETIGFFLLILIIGDISIGGRDPAPPGHTYDSSWSNL